VREEGRRGELVETVQAFKRPDLTPNLRITRLAKLELRCRQTQVGLAENKRSGSE
jgi:hypothetical protein